MIFTFGKTTKRCPLKMALKVHNPQFYWKVNLRSTVCIMFVTFQMEITKNTSIKIITPNCMKFSPSLRWSVIYFFRFVMTQADLGFADAYISGDCLFVDKDEGLFHFFYGNIQI